VVESGNVAALLERKGSYYAMRRQQIGGQHGPAQVALQPDFTPS
jgi:hypothetical protein